MTMMRERAQIGGGTFEVFSVPGQGTTITVRFPTSLLQQEPAPAPAESDPGAGVSSGAPPPGHTDRRIGGRRHPRHRPRLRTSHDHDLAR